LLKHGQQQADAKYGEQNNPDLMPMPDKTEGGGWGGRSLGALFSLGLSGDGLVKRALSGVGALRKGTGVIGIVGTGLTQDFAGGGLVELNAGVPVGFELETTSTTDQIGRFYLVFAARTQWHQLILDNACEGGKKCRSAPLLAIAEQAGETAEPSLSRYRFEILGNHPP